jgi:hypothetical protein
LVFQFSDVKAVLAERFQEGDFCLRSHPRRCLPPGATRCRTAACQRPGSALRISSARSARSGSASNDAKTADPVPGRRALPPPSGRRSTPRLAEAHPREADPPVVSRHSDHAELGPRVRPYRSARRRYGWRTGPVMPNSKERCPASISSRIPTSAVSDANQISGSQTGSQRRQTSGEAGRRPATTSPATRHFRPPEGFHVQWVIFTVVCGFPLKPRAGLAAGP